MADTSPSPVPESYESALAELERLVARIEAGDIALDDLLAHYQRGTELLAFCRGRLEAVEAQIKVVDEGLPKPWAPT